MLPTTLSACQKAFPVYEPGRLDKYEGHFHDLISPGTKISLLAEGFKWTEGPAWDTKRGLLYFSDIPNNKMMRWSRKNGLGTFLEVAGRHASLVDQDAAPGTNGLLYERGNDGLFICNQNARSIDFLDLKSRLRETVATTFNGLLFNSPNDLIRAKDGTIFFTDPPYGLLDQETFKGMMQPHFGVYRISTDGIVSLVSGEMTRPNGIALSIDERTLYVSQSDPKAPIIQSFKLDDLGRPVNSSVFANFTDLLGNNNPGLPDGMAVDQHGNIFATGPGGVIILNSNGLRLGRIYTGKATSNCAFGEDGSTLFMTAHDTLLSIDTKTKGFNWT